MSGSDEEQRVREALFSIPCALVDEHSWVLAGMALKEGGYPCSLWDEWSATDHARYHVGECERRWNGFNGSENPVGLGTLFNMAHEYGHAQARRESADKVLDWDDEFDAPEVSATMEPWEQAYSYIDALFEPGDIVGYRLEASEHVNAEGKAKLIPCGNGSYGRTAFSILNDLRRYHDIGDAIGDTSIRGEGAEKYASHDAGAWIHINPLNGLGTGNANVAAYRHILIESDSGTLAEQRAIIESLHLPVVALVSSGKKSIHAVVRIGASNLVEYHRRRERVWKVCRDAGLDIDEANKNPSRLSRFPGFRRGDGFQELLFVDKHPMSWEQWTNGGSGSELPRSVSLADVWNDMPKRKPWLIDGILRQGHKMIVTGDSKAGKSFALMELAVAIAEGGEWFGHKVENRGPVLYVNLEIDDASAMWRVRDIYTASGQEPLHADELHMWNLRGKGKTISYLADHIVWEALRLHAVAIFIDPIYKIEEGDENSAGDMAKLCSQFDSIVDRTGASLIYAHHHAKGAQGGKKAIDRGSGSGVFSRDPDAIIDMSPIHLSDELKDECTDEDGLIVKTAWRVEMTLRESCSPKPFSIWFEYPLHVRDERLDECGVDGDLESAQAMGRATQAKNAGEIRSYRRALLIAAFNEVQRDGIAYVPQVLMAYNTMCEGIDNLSADTFRKWRQFDWCPIEGTGNVKNELRLKA